ncbi:MAG: site-specific integrase [Duncaniella sp.]|nr:site-specific integrase [Duncaniella sp.]
MGKRYTRTKTEREHLTEDELHRIMDLDLRMFPRLDLVRDTFVFCCFCGLAFVDISTLTRDQIVTDNDGEIWIRKNRQKTGEVSTIPLLDIPKKIAEKYRNHPKAAEKNVVIPVISNQRMNSYLGEIAAKAEVKKHLTTHIARHTFATMSLNNHVPIETISKILGHSDITTTQIYARMLDKTISEDMERMRAKFDTMPVEIRTIPEPPTTFVPEPKPRRGRPRKFQ